LFEKTWVLIHIAKKVVVLLFGTICGITVWHKEKNTKREKIRSFITVVGFILLMGLFYGCQWKDKKHILVVHSYSETNDWVATLNKGIHDCLQRKGVSATVETIYLDDEEMDINEETARLDAILNAYTHTSPDLILVCDDEAFMSLLNTNHPLTYDLPVVFCGVDYVPYDLLSNRSNITGFTTKPDYQKCYLLARQLFDRIDDIVLIAEDSWLGKSSISTARDQLMGFSNLTQVYESYWSYSETDTLRSPRGVVNPFQLRIERIDMLPGSHLKSILYHKPQSFCVLPYWHSYYTSLPHMGTAPFLMVNNEGFGNGQIGGYMTPSYNQTYEAMKVGIEILKGKKVETFPIVASEQYLVLDWEQLVFRNIDMNRIPKDSIIVNMPFREKYHFLIVTGSLLFFFFLGLFIVLMLRLYRREAYNKLLVDQRLKKEQKELDITIESLKEGLVSMDAKGVLLSINSAAIKWLGLNPAEDYTGQSVWSLFNIYEKDNLYYLKNELSILSQTLGSHKLSDTAYIITADKKAFSVAGSISSLHHQGHSYGSVISFHDTTNEYTQKEYLALSMISGDIFAWRFDQTTKSLYFDESFLQAFQVPDNGAHTIHYSQFRKIIHPDDMDEWNRAIRDIFIEKKGKTTLRLRLKFNEDANYQWWEYRMSALPKSTRESRYNLVGICINIEKFKQTEEELIRLRDEAEKSDYEKGLFLANMSHEVRTPLNSIVGFSSLLIDDEKLTDESRNEFIGIVNENCRLLLKLINEILDISRIESGITFRKEPCDLTRLIEEIIDQYPIDKYEEVGLILDVPDEPVELINDSFRLRQILINLVDNAFKFTQKGHISLGYQVDDEKKEVVLFVKDTGVGISKEEISKIFKRFYKSDDFIQGGGLGLPIVKEIVKRMQGRIRVESEVNEGTAFYVYLPIESMDQESGNLE